MASIDNRPVILGYYRYSDIMFEWREVLTDPHQRSALNGFLAPTSLVHPDHPLRQEGHDGLELWNGILTNGESRLLFSSAQVEYARYYLKAAGLINVLVPLPSSQYLLTTSHLKNVSPVYFTDPQVLKKALANIQKLNNRLKGITGDIKLEALRIKFERARTLWSAKKGVWCAVDFESWEMKHDDITEFGYSMYRWEDGKLVGPEEGHWTVKEMNSTRNFKYVPDNRNNYQFGTSIEKPRKVFGEDLRTFIAGLKRYGPVYLSFHDAPNDIQYMKQFKVPEAEEATNLIPETNPDSGIFIIDTADLFAALEGRSNERRGLERMCRLLKMYDTYYMHNAGNDAHWTLLALKDMIAGDPLDTQREKRWPSQMELSKTGAKTATVAHHPWELDPEYDDMEGIFEPFQGVPESPEEEALPPIKNAYTGRPKPPPKPHSQ
ncbi:uncharacterized protein EI90DRAFT_3176960 [Cantharellus anzutake]|uniref:uncharacterized protein n=1 Tax=Cantharellus anzutake TaxID=1750568 RepID=UPI0019056EA9|nr:uncharacterized protein EI90DRAFT_3176960 [Cantharellus anzutake]KAF8335065.1 hypothetical protein EI90DRAFT_3176960 [Cantharellus anzutake]